MKRNNLLLILILFSLISCATKLKNISRYENLSVVDFTKYTSEGFLITTEPYKGKYKAIGILDYVVRPKAKKQKDIYSSGYTEHHWKIEEIKIQALLDTLYSRAEMMGGDAIMNFDIKPNSKRYSDGSNVIEIPGIEFYGFVIKRIE